jgi:hypothetical protein
VVHRCLRLHILNKDIYAMFFEYLEDCLLIYESSQYRLANVGLDLGLETVELSDPV